MKIPALVARWLFVLCLPLLLLTAGLAWGVNSFWLYHQGLVKYDITRATGLAQPELDKAATGLINYFNSGEDAINITVTRDGKPLQLFNEREIVHLRDVKALIRLDYLVLALTLAYAAAYAAFSLRRRQLKQLAKAAVIGSGLTLVLMLALGVGMMYDFSDLFWQFHLISFSNDFWLLDPSKDYLVMMFPEPFWYDAAMYIALAAAGGAVLLGGSSATYLRLASRRDQ